MGLIPASPGVAAVSEDGPTGSELDDDATATGDVVADG